jgi:SAM-dependent methyltransferase
MKRTMPAVFLAGLWGWAGPTGTCASQTAAPAANVSPPKVAIAYVPTRHDTVRDLLWLAEVNTNDIVYDLGSGDGRVVIAAVRDFHARRAVGIELDPKLVQESRSNAVAAGVADRVEIIHGDLFAQDFSAASVVVLYLGHRANLDLRPHLLRTVKPGARVVSHQFGMGEWVKDKTLDIRTPILGMYGEMWNEFKTNPEVPDFDDSRSRASHDELSSWIVPAPVAGVWRGKVRTEAGAGELTLTLHQRLSGVSGSFQFQGPTNLSGSVTADLWGDHLRCWCIPTNTPWYPSQMWVHGRVQGNALTGVFQRWQGTNTAEAEWTAHRDQVDFTGTWEWRGASNAPVQFKIERRNGRLAATYADQNREKNAWRDETRPVPVFDLYDFGGGYYFTLLLGLEGTSYRGGSRRMGPQDGWLVGDAVIEDGTLRGTLAFHPYSRSSMPGLNDSTQSKPTPASSRRDWQPKRMAP